MITLINCKISLLIFRVEEHKHYGEFYSTFIISKFEEDE